MSKTKLQRTINDLDSALSDGDDILTHGEDRAIRAILTRLELLESSDDYDEES